MLRFAILALAICGISACLAGLNPRERADQRDPLRRCGAEVPTSSDIAERAVRCAEWFVRTQGYTSEAPHSDTLRLVPEGIEWADGRLEWLRSRRGRLVARARAVCFEAQRREVVVAFAYSEPSDQLRVVTLTQDGHSLRMQHSGFNTDLLASGEYGCRLVPDASPPAT